MDSSILVPVIVAIITGGLSLVGVVITNMNGNKQIESKLMVAQGITDTKIDQLTKEVKQFTDYADRLPRIETRLDNIEKRIDKMDNDNK